MNDRSNESLLARRALAEKATPGPWRYEKKGGSGPGVKTYAILDSRDWPVGAAYDLTVVNNENAAHIAANSPDVVMAHVDEILRLRAEVKHLEREADWLANQIRDCPDEVDQEAYWDICKREDCRGFGKEDVAACWRRAARKAVEENAE